MQVQLDLPADLARIREIGAQIETLIDEVEGVLEREVTSYNVQLAAQEICVNIVEHAYEGVQNGRIQATLRLDRARRQLQIELSDTGQPFDWSKAEEPNLDEAHDHGYGMFLARALLDELSYEHEGGTNRWLLTKNL